MTAQTRARQFGLPLLLCALATVGCGSSDDATEEAKQTPFSLRFAAAVDGAAVGCADALAGFGPQGTHQVGINDLRFYVSNLRLMDARGRAVALSLDEDEFQYASADGEVALVDLTGTSEGTCSASSVAYAEGTARTHAAITGKTVVDQVASVSFDVGVPQALMKATIATNTPEGAPSPLNEMYWNWNSGYRHFVFNFQVRDDSDTLGAGYVHVGSRDCAPEADGVKALSDRDTCTYVNTPRVEVPSFDLGLDTIGIDLRRVTTGVDFVSPIYDPTTFEVIGEGPGVECHSSPMQPDCAPVFASFGLDVATGGAQAASDLAFVKLR